jgi:hypothetical protein
VIHFYHLWKGGGWEAIAAEHHAALRAAEFTGEVRVTEVESGWEDVTLNQVRTWAQTADPAEPVLYCHNKGAFTQSPVQDLWRRQMTGYLIGQWRDRVRELEHSDVAAWSWVNPSVHGYSSSMFTFSVTRPMAVGNFWWATAGYLSGLPELPVLTAETRHEAEFWLGGDVPRVEALKLDVWPDPDTRKQRPLVHPESAARQPGWFQAEPGGGSSFQLGEYYVRVTTPMHTHFTREILPVGQCPGCDAYWAKNKPEKKRVKVEPVAEGELEQLLIEFKKAKEQAAEGKEREEELKARIKGFLLTGVPEELLPDAYDIPGDPNGRYPGFSLTLKGGRRLDTDTLKRLAPEVYEAYLVDQKPAWELREAQQRRR